jgi:hypothetical protein
MRNTILHVLVSTGFLSRNQEIRSFQVPNFQVHSINEGIFNFKYFSVVRCYLIAMRFFIPQFSSYIDDTSLEKIVPHTIWIGFNFLIYFITARFQKYRSMVLETPLVLGIKIKYS